MEVFAPDQLPVVFEIAGAEIRSAAGLAALAQQGDDAARR